MKTCDLIAEIDHAQRALDATHRAQLAALGIPRLIVECGFVGAARIRLEKDGRTYRPMEGGTEAFITPCRVNGDQPTPEDPDFELVPQYGDVIDLIAWSPEYPGRWATRCDQATWLGCIEPQFVIPPAVPIRRSPLSWLKANATGLCILAHDQWDIYRLLTVCQQLEAEDDAHAKQLRRILEHPFKTPTILVARRWQPKATTAQAKPRFIPETGADKRQTVFA
jgi:hypothetical protein